MLSPGTVSSSASSVRRSPARPTSVPSGRRKTKSPKPKLSSMNLRRSCRSTGDSFWRNAAPTDSASALFAGTLDWSATGTSGCTSRTRRANATPASGEMRPSIGNSMSEMTPSTFSRYAENVVQASSNVWHSRIFGRA